MCFLVNSVTEVHQIFRITVISFTLILVLFAKKLKTLRSLCMKALKAYPLLSGVVYFYTSGTHMK